MMPFDTVTLIICAVVIVTAIVTPMMNIFFRKVRIGEDASSPEEDEKLPPLSVLLTVHDNARELERHLPAILSQDYPAGYEVIVVVSKGEDDTDDVLKQFAVNYPNLYITFIPDTSRYMSRKKLAITLGVKAAKNEWILMTDATCHPASDKWLKEMAQQCDAQTDIIIGYCNYDDDSSDYQRFERLVSQRYILRQTQRGIAYRCEPGNLMFRKALFLDGRGFEGNLKYIRGEYDFIVNKFARRENTCSLTAADAWMIEDAPVKKLWNNRHLYYMETKRHLKRSFLYRLPIYSDQFAMHFNYLLIIAAVVYGTVILLRQSDNLQTLVLLGSATLAFLITITLRTIIAKKAFRQFGEDIPIWKIIPFEISTIWRYLWYWLKYKMADKYNFICHKV